MEKQQLRVAHSPCTRYYDVPPGGPFRTERCTVTAIGNVINRQHSAVSIPEENCQGFWNLDLLTWGQRGLAPSPNLNTQSTTLKGSPSFRTACWLRPSLGNFNVTHLIPMPNPASFSSFLEGLIPKHSLINFVCATLHFRVSFPGTHQHTQSYISWKCQKGIQTQAYLAPNPMT